MKLVVGRELQVCVLLVRHVKHQQATLDAHKHLTTVPAVLLLLLLLLLLHGQTLTNVPMCYET